MYVLFDLGAFGALKLRPVKHRHTQGDDVGVEAQQAIFESELVTAGGHPELPAVFAKQLLEDGFEQLPRPLPVGVSKVAVFIFRFLPRLSLVHSPTPPRQKPQETSIKKDLYAALGRQRPRSRPFRRGRRYQVDSGCTHGLMGTRWLTFSQWLQPYLPKNHRAGSSAAEVPVIPDGPPILAAATAVRQGFLVGHVCHPISNSLVYGPDSG